MELSKDDAYLVLRTAYKTGLMKKMTEKKPIPEQHVPGTSVLDQPAGGMDYAMVEEYGKFLAELIDEVRKEGKQ